MRTTATDTGDRNGARSPARATNGVGAPTAEGDAVDRIATFIAAIPGGNRPAGGQTILGEVARPGWTIRVMDPGYAESDQTGLTRDVLFLRVQLLDDDGLPRQIWTAKDVVGLGVSKLEAGAQLLLRGDAFARGYEIAMQAVRRAAWPSQVSRQATSDAVAATARTLDGDVASATSVDRMRPRAEPLPSSE